MIVYPHVKLTHQLGFVSDKTLLLSQLVLQCRVQTWLDADVVWSVGNSGLLG